MISLFEQSDEIAKPCPDMNIKVTTFIVTKKLYNTPIYKLKAKVQSLENLQMSRIKLGQHVGLVCPS